jgi:hypothetical protein
MPGPSDIPRGNIQLAMLLNLTISPAQVAINTTVEQTFTLQGLQLGDIVAVTKPTTQAGLGIVNSRVTAANTIGITFVNATAGTITPTASETYIVELNRPTNPQNALPTAIT